MNFEEYLIGLQLISDEGLGKKVRALGQQDDAQDAESRRQLGVVDG